jgi:hypothetical protein
MDVVCFEDLDEFGEDLDDPVAELLQDILHMLLEDFGSNADAPNRSIGLEAALSGTSDPSLKHRVETRLADDPRIIAVEATFVQVENGPSDDITITLRIQADAGTLGIELLFDGAGNYTGFRRTA